MTETATFLISNTQHENTFISDLFNCFQFSLKKTVADDVAAMLTDTPAEFLAV